ncbi:restriction endonuclease subunit S [Shewanella baltica]|uniref:restriction endonuclease subunit S n=1 Tax=Shewanella baltica TaxID=62322 RepID=UPI00217EF327|nr:restriction endonuclease subunit S [Shewanella baltica]MCS6174542.1 restriction endonuclease subunit S [Shewanella baltica]
MADLSITDTHARNIKATPTAENLITTHLDIWTTAIEQKSSAGRGSSNKFTLYGIKKLRELILELAVRGKLVPQAPNYEPASVLLERIAAEKAQLVKEGKIKKAKTLPRIGEVDEPFRLPRGWEWSRIGVLAALTSGKGFKKAEYSDSGARLFQIANVSLGYTKWDIQNYLPLSYLTEYPELNLSSGDVLIALNRPLLNNLMKVCILSESDLPSILYQRVGKFDFYGDVINTRYFYYFLKSPLFIDHLEDNLQGSDQPFINQSQLVQFLVSIPPKEEQQRIVAKVDELMSFCDALEAQTEASIAAHQTLVETLLNALLLPQTTANTASQSDVSLEPQLESRSQHFESSPELPFTNHFDKDWQRVAEHFDTLFTTSASIDTLKQTILQLAVMGKLVKQDPNDEPAAKLLARIAKEKAQLVKNKVYQKSSNLKSRNKSVIYPTGWVGVQTGEVCPSIVPNRDRPKSFSGNIPWVTLPAFPKESLYLDHRKVELALSESEVIQYSARLIPEGSVLMSCVGRFGLTAINRVPVTSNQQVHAFIILDGLLPEFLSIVIKVEGQALECVATSTTIAYLNKTNCESIQFGLPPLEEQHRIVAKVDELMAQCDQLKARLADAQTTQLHLTDAIVEQAV